MPQVQNTLYFIHFGRIPFSHFKPLLLIPFLSLQYKEMVIMGGWAVIWEISEQNKFNRLQMIQFECPRFRNPMALCTTNKVSKFGALY